jgi:hypothetical protein
MSRSMLYPGWGRVYSYSARSPEISWLNPPLQGYVHTTHASGHDIRGIFKSPYKFLTNHKKGCLSAVLQQVHKPLWQLVAYL